MSSQPSQDPVVQQLQLLLTGYGYNFYSSVNQARTDDQLVRERASYHLSQTIELLARLRSNYHLRFVPPLTRANPDPPAEAMAKIREIEATRQEISNLETAIRGMPVPAQDRTWWRFRQEEPLLHQLLGFDLALVRQSEQLYQYVMQLTPESWHGQGSSMLQPMIYQLTQTIHERERFLLIQL